MFTDPAHLWTVGASVGTAFSIPWLIGTVHGTAAPFRNVFFEVGVDLGLLTFKPEVKSYFSLYPFVHAAFFMPFKYNFPFDRGGWYAGLGAGYMMAFYNMNVGRLPKNIFAIDVFAGANILNMIDISYTLRVKPDFSKLSVGHKFSIGYVYRFLKKEATDDWEM